ncbi:hypothetical protein N3K66_002173 [Trichothecium roseum]|uniref:Uncharacterized protein n=1 Tax=Trichothecium roseum TaxID=47278 RepID=A0ACC0V8U4_9HYPO|nr:hypothetical protein N3K66_002173 [Trichothecium roseum]
MRGDDASIELGSLLPDDPLSSPTMSSPSPSPSPPPSFSAATPPRWLRRPRRQPRFPSVTIRRASSRLANAHALPLLRRLATLLRPRPTWRYVLSSAAALYVLYCLVTAQPLLASNLPPYTGPHGVGALDIEVPLGAPPRRVSDAVFRSSGDPAFEVESVLLTLYYPTEKGFRSDKPRYPWVPRPIGLTAEGYAKVAHIDNFVTRPVFTFFLWALAGSITIPAEVDAPLLAADPFPPEDQGGADDARTEPQQQQQQQQKQQKFPLVVFSHGMASSRTDYTNYLGELASRGHVVAALEHRDGSSPGSLVRLGPSDPGRRRLPIHPSDLRGGMDTPEFKRAQLAYRDAEILAAIELLHAINAGIPINNVRASTSSTSSNSGSNSSANLPSWTRRLNTTHLTIAGHSYGATGALQALSTASPSPGTTTSIILDPGKSSGPLSANVSAPSLVIHSDSWSRRRSLFHGRPHFDTVRDLVRGVAASPHRIPAWFLTSRDTSHPSVTDAPLIEPLLLSWTTGSGTDVRAALAEYVRASDEFLRFARTGRRSPLLSEAVTHEEYGKWVSEERRREFPKDWARRWEIHVAPDVIE